MALPTLIIGGGVVGLACAAALARAGVAVVLVERHARLGEETSSRNSEVIHAGIYYPPRSQKAQLCIEGRRLLLAFCERQRVPYRLCGKLIVACEESERAALDTIEARAEAAGASVQLQRWTAAQVRTRAPAVRAVEALWSGGTGIVDAHALMDRLAACARRDGALLLVGHAVIAAEPGPSGHEVALRVGDRVERHRFAAVINAAGHGAPAIAGLAGFAAPRQVAVKGSYFALTCKAPSDALIYPVPRPNLVGLGTHLTLDLAGRARLGPDVELPPVAAEDGPLDHGVDARRAPAFLAAAQHFLPGLRLEDLRPDYAGFRPKLAVDRFEDFALCDRSAEGMPGWIDLFGIESPGLTAALAIAEWARAVLDGAAPSLTSPDP